MAQEVLLIRIERLRTPIGEMLLATDLQANLRAVDWEDCEQRMHRLFQIHYGYEGYTIEHNQAPSKAAMALDLYFQGEVRAIEDLTVATNGTVFQRGVWHALRSIPIGTTTSYSSVAKMIGRPDAVRAVGAANGCNPVGVVVPCHRVIGADGSLTGYAGGIERKKWLLGHEQNRAGYVDQCV